MSTKQSIQIDDKSTLKQQPPQPDRQNSRPQISPPTVIQPSRLDLRRLTPRLFVQLQRLIGNRAVVQLARWTSLHNRDNHYAKHSSDANFAYTSATQYGNAASNFVDSLPPGTQSKTRTDGTTVYYHAPTDRLVIITSYGAIMTFFQPGRGNSAVGQQYFNRQ